MIQFTIKTEHLIGFAAETVSPGAVGNVITKNSMITSDDPMFHIYMKHITSLFLLKINIHPAEIIKMLILIHDDDVADIYINDFVEIATMRAKKDFGAGEVVYRENISDIVGMQFSGIDIKETDAVIYCARTDWRFSLFFNFTREIKRETLTKELGALKHEAEFHGLIDSTKYELNRASVDSADALITTEGKTDWLHLKKAAEKLDVDLKIGFDEYNDARGDTDTLKMCEHFARLNQPRKIVFVFDSDNKEIRNALEAKTSGTDRFQRWGNNVYSLMIPTPAHRSSTAGISIELLYQDEELKRCDESGRRLYLGNEFHEKTGRHITSSSFICTERSKCGPGKIVVIDKNVHDKDNKNVALPKSHFAEKVYNDKDSFSDFGFSEFEPIFDVIREIIALPLE